MIPRLTPLLAAVLATQVCLRAQETLLAEDFNGALGTQPPGWTVVSDAPATLAARNDGAGEHEHRLIAENASSLRALSHFTVPEQTDTGAWRDTTVSAVLRFSGGANMLNGILARARNADLAAGDFYHARLNGGLIELFRFNNGSPTLLGTAAWTGSGTVVDRLFSLSTRNLPAAGSDRVEIRVDLHNGATAASGVLQTLSFTDTSASAVTRAGGTGVRTLAAAAASSGQRTTFDDFRVVSNHPNLLWYDDYHDNAGIRAQNFASGSSPVFTSQRLEFQSVASASAGISTLNFDAETGKPAWENVSVSGRLRLNTNVAGGGALAGGVIARETGVSAADGTGSYYHYRLLRDENTATYAAQLYRVNAGVSSLLAETPLGDAEVPESADLFLRLDTVTDAAGVLLSGTASFLPDFSATFGAVSFTDADAARLTGPGATGFRYNAGSGLVAGAINFDNFTTTAVVIPEPGTGALALAGLFWLRRVLRRAN